MKRHRKAKNARCPRCGRVLRRTSRDASRYSYGGVRMCPCPGETRAPQMLTYDPEDDRFSRDPNREPQIYTKTIDGSQVRFSHIYHPRTGWWWQWELEGRGGQTLPMGSQQGITQRQAEAKARHFLRRLHGTSTWPPKRDVKGGSIKRSRPPKGKKKTRTELWARVIMQRHKARRRR